MKTKLAIVLTLVALNSQAALINVTYHDWTKVEFHDGGGTQPEQYYFNNGVAQFASMIDIHATPNGTDVDYTVHWVTATYQIVDTFTLTHTGPVGFGGTTVEYRPLLGHWYFTYLNPDPASTGSNVPDGGNALVLVGAGLLGLWRFRR